MNDVPAPPPEPSNDPPPTPPPVQPQGAPPPVPPSATAPPAGATPGQVAPPENKSGKAVASMVLGIVGLVSLFCAWILFQVPALVLGVLAIVFGRLAKQEIAANPGMEGEGQAKAGFIMGIICTTLAGIGFVVMVIAAAS